MTDHLLERLKELRKMPYAEYLQSPEWQQRRQEALTFANRNCQVCNAQDIELHVHHRTYDRRGMEMASDLTVLCRNCHALFHGKDVPRNDLCILTTELEIYDCLQKSHYDTILLSRDAEYNDQLIWEYLGRDEDNDTDDRLFFFLIPHMFIKENFSNHWGYTSYPNYKAFYLPTNYQSWLDILANIRDEKIFVEKLKFAVLAQTNEGQCVYMTCEEDVRHA